MNTSTALTAQQSTQLATHNNHIAKLGQAADHALSKSVFSLYLAEKSLNTARTHRAALNAFSQFLKVGTGELFQTTPEAWQEMTAGLVEAFNIVQLEDGVAPSTINLRLSTIKTYVKLAMKGEAINADEATRIRAVTGYGRKAVTNINEKRQVAGLEPVGNRDKVVTYQRNGKTINRVGVKKAEHVSISNEQATALITDYDLSTGQGARDALLMSIALQHGLRCSELALLEVGNIKKEDGKWYMKFVRPKVSGTDRETGNHVLTPATVKAWLAYQPYALAMGKLFRGSRKAKTGEPAPLTDGTMSQRAITKRINKLASKIGVDGFSAHDCRHYCATDMATKNYSIPQLMDWFGWNTERMATYYIEATTVQERLNG